MVPRDTLVFERWEFFYIITNITTFSSGKRKNMIDIKTVRENPQWIKESSRKKGAEVNVERILELDKERRELLSDVESVRAKKNEASKKLGQATGKEKESIIEEMRSIDSGNAENRLKEVEEELEKEMLLIPNPPFEDVLVGESDDDNEVIRKEGDIKEFSFTPKDYIQIAEDLDIIDIKRAAKVSGSRFGILKGEGALLHLALVNLAMEVCLKHGFSPVIPPVMIRPEMMQAMGYVERGGDEIYQIEKDNLYLVGTSEQIIGPMHAGEVFERKDLPKRYVGYSSCFRREAGSYGKDTKGILRVHQFEKIEMFSLTNPEDSKEEHKFLLGIEEELMGMLKIPYRVIDICSGDLGDPAASKYDIEAWMPGQGEYRETHSTSNCTDFQSRRLNIRHKDGGFVHMLNGTALATGRIIIALLENNQKEDGSVIIPEVLHKYLPFKEIK